MNVKAIQTCVVTMLTALTTWVVTHALVGEDTLEMEHTVKVNTKHSKVI